LNILKLSSFILYLLQFACLKPPSYLRMLKTRFKRGVNFSISSSAVLHKSLTATMKGSRSSYIVLSLHRLLSVLPASLPTVWLYAKRRIEDKNCFQARSQNCEKLLLASSCLSVRTKQLGSHRTDFHEI
jgi:hypothetical protein